MPPDYRGEIIHRKIKQERQSLTRSHAASHHLTHSLIYLQTLLNGGCHSRLETNNFEKIVQFSAYFSCALIAAANSVPAKKGVLEICLHPTQMNAMQNRAVQRSDNDDNSINFPIDVCVDRLIAIDWNCPLIGCVWQRVPNTDIILSKKKSTEEAPTSGTARRDWKSLTHQLD